MESSVKPGSRVGDEPLSSASSLDKLNPLLGELKRVISELASLSEGARSSTVSGQTKYQRNLARLCYILEKILEHGLKDVALFGTTQFWNYLQNLDQCLPGLEAKEVVRRVKDLGKTSLARGRLFLRILLNEGTLGENLRAMMWNIPLTDSFYRNTAILRDEEQSGVLLALLESLTVFRFNFVLVEKGIDDPDYWTKLLRSSSEDAARSSTASMKAPPRGLTEDLNHSFSLPSLETINCIVEQAESQGRELDQARKMVLDLKVQLEMERKEKDSVNIQHSALQESYQFLTDRLRDMEVELNVYKAQLEARQQTETISTESPLELDILQEVESAVQNSPAKILKIPLFEEDTSADSEDWNEHTSMIYKLQQAQSCIQQIKDGDKAINEQVMKLGSFQMPDTLESTLE